MNDQVIINIPIGRIHILNHPPDPKYWLVSLISKKPGHKNPLPVRRTSSDTGDEEYVLVCGHGRFVAFLALGCQHVPVVVVEDLAESRFEPTSYS